MYVSTFGCRTFTATFLPLYLAWYTWLTEPEATGTGSNSSKISSIFLPYASLKFFRVVSREWKGALYLRYSTLSASSGPIISLLWLKYWKALMKTTPALSIDLTKQSIQKDLVALKKSRGVSSMGGVKMRVRWKNRTICVIILQSF